MVREAMPIYEVYNPAIAQVNDAAQLSRTSGA